MLKDAEFLEELAVKLAQVYQLKKVHGRFLM